MLFSEMLFFICSCVISYTVCFEVRISIYSVILRNLMFLLIFEMLEYFMNIEFPVVLAFVLFIKIKLYSKRLNWNEI